MSKLLLIIGLIAVIPVCLLIIDIISISRQIKNFYNKLHKGQIVKIRNHGSTEYRIVNVHHKQQMIVCITKNSGLLKFKFNDIQFEPKSFLFK